MKVTPNPASTARAYRLLQPELEPDVEVAELDTLPPECVLDDLPDAGALLHEDQRLLAKRVEGHGPTGEPVPCADTRG